MSEFDCAVIVPAFNAAAFLGETLDALVGQTVPARKVIVVDDGSTDATPAIVDSYGPRVELLQQANSGQGVARALGIADCDTQWIALCDADDVWEAEHLSRRHALLQAFPDAEFTMSDCCSFGAQAGSSIGVIDAAPSSWIQDWGSPVDDEVFWLDDPMAATLVYNPFYPSGLVFSRESYERMGGFLPRYSRWRAEDMEFTRRYFARGEVKALCDLRKTWRYRRHDGNYSSKQWLNLLARAKILEEHESQGLVPDRLRKATEREIGSARAAAFDIAYWDGDFAVARDLYRRELPDSERSPKRRLRMLHAWFAARGKGKANLAVSP